MIIVANKIYIEPEPETDEVQDTEAPVANKAKGATALRKFADFDFKIPNNWLKQQIPFGLFIVLLTAIHIWNAHYTERLVRNTIRLQNETKELRSEYITLLSLLMSESKQSSVAAKLDTLGIKELRTPPVKIKVDVQ
jgi:cell division protein FtsL